MNIIDSLNWRYATKKFDSEKLISNDKLNLLKEAFSLTPTSYGLQPVKLVVVQNKELQKELVPHSYNQGQVGQASHLLIICTENIIDEAYIRAYFENEKTVRGTTDDTVNAFRSYLIETFSSMTTKDIKDWATKQAYITLGNLLTVCAVEKIDSCPMEGFLPEKYNDILDLTNKGLSAVLVLPIGVRADDDIFSEFKKVRKNIEQNVITL